MKRDSREWRAAQYNAKFPKRPPLTYCPHTDMVVGYWMIGACYKNPNKLYGAYPHGYLERVHAMFPYSGRTLHAFSGGLTVEQAKAAHGGFYDNGQTMLGASSVVLVDMHGPEQGRFPTWQGDLHDFCELHASMDREPFDLILADPPYSKGDAKKYDCPPPNRRKVMESLWRVARPGANLVWLDQVWPQHKKAQWQTWATIGLTRSTMHRIRGVTIFERQP